MISTYYNLVKKGKIFYFAVAKSCLFYDRMADNGSPFGSPVRFLQPAFEKFGPGRNKFYGQLSQDFSAHFYCQCEYRLYKK